MQFRLDKEGREFHHYDDFCQLYRAEILNLNRILDALVRNGVLPSNFVISTGSQVLCFEIRTLNLFCINIAYLEIYDEKEKLLFDCSLVQQIHL